MKTYTVVADLGKRRDRTAFFVWKAKQVSTAVLNEERLIWAWVVVHLGLFQGVPYHEVVDDLALLMGHPELVRDSDLLVDAQNIGEPVIEMMRAKGLAPIPILTTGGQTVREVKEQAGFVFANRSGRLMPLQTYQEIHVPKNDLVGAGRKVVQQKRVTLAQDMFWADKFKEQMRNFRGIQSGRSRATKFEAEDEMVHDDFVWCYLAAAWWCTRGGADEQSLMPVAAGGDRLPDWNPLDHI
jgi:hypothetical protein